ncbi:hypothetical protein [Rhodococcus rhodochrous]|uniref:hypothetical protein n=1 Tax=Rhodococcus rhodochrous TaxID=1829 RepID=UPI0024B8FB8C|nr:hypothetical protein [Rhodococcus rhodochrous]MDJ0401238.1 hypothetical protein [Rhodococcus rhodochrous]
MTDNQPSKAFRRVQGPLTTADAVILGIAVSVFLAVLVVGIAALWHMANPEQMNASWWDAAGAIGTWYAGTMTLAAVAAALREGRQAKRIANDAQDAEERRHHQRLLEEKIHADLQRVSGLVPDLEAFAKVMFSADVHYLTHSLFQPSDSAVSFKLTENGPVSTQGGNPSSNPMKDYGTFVAACSEIREKLQTVRVAVRVDSVRESVVQAIDIVALIQSQLFSWFLQLAQNKGVAVEADKLTELESDARWKPPGHLHPAARLAQEIIYEALDAAQKQKEHD